MEEKDVKVEGGETPKKFTYEELENIAGNLSSQVQQLTARLQEANMFNVFKRLDYCFKVIENASAFNPDFINVIVTEVEAAMTIKEEDKEVSDSEK